MPIFQTSTFVFKTAEEGKSFFELAYGLREQGANEEPGLIYSRINNPDLQILEERLTLWDGAEASLVFGSGMAAISTTLLTFLRPGDTLVHNEPIYGGTEHLVENVLPKFGIEKEVFGSYAGRADPRAGAWRRPRHAGASASSSSRRRPTRPTTWSTSRSVRRLPRRYTGPDGRRPLVVDRQHVPRTARGSSRCSAAPTSSCTR